MVACIRMHALPYNGCTCTHMHACTHTTTHIPKHISARVHAKIKVEAGLLNIRVQTHALHTPGIEKLI